MPSYNSTLYYDFHRIVYRKLYMKLVHRSKEVYVTLSQLLSWKAVIESGMVWLRFLL